MNKKILLLFMFTSCTVLPSERWNHAGNIKTIESLFNLLSQRNNDEKKLLLSNIENRLERTTQRIYIITLKEREKYKELVQRFTQTFVI